MWERELKLSCCFANAVPFFFPAASQNEFSKETGEE